MDDGQIVSDYDESLTQWQANGWACKNCGDLEMLEATDENTIVNGPFVNGQCNHCNNDGFDTPEHEGHQLRVTYPATEMMVGYVTDEHTLKMQADTRRFELESDAEPTIYCMTCGDVEVLPAEAGLIPDEWKMEI